MRNPRAGAVASCLLVAMIVLGAWGCSGEPEEMTASAGAPSDPDGSPSPGAEPSPDASPGPEAPPSSSAAPDADPEAAAAPAAPVLPAAATVPDAAGAQAFMQHYWEVVNHAYATRDASVLGPLSHPECDSCATIVDNIAEAVDTGAVIRDLAFLPEQLETTPGQIDGVPPESLVMRTTGLLVCPPGATAVYPDGTVLGTDCIEVEGIYFGSQWMGDRWNARTMNFPERSG